MSPFHFCLSAAKNLSSFQFLPASLFTDLLQLFLGLPLFLFPWGFQNRAAFDISPSSFLNVWPIHRNYIDTYQSYTSLQPVTRWRSWLRHGTKSRKFSRSITDGVIQTFYSHNPSASYNWVQGVSPGGKGGRCVGLNFLYRLSRYSGFHLLESEGSVYTRNVTVFISI